MKNTNLVTEENSNMSHMKAIIKKKRQEFLNKKIKQIEMRLYRLNEIDIEDAEDFICDETEYETSAFWH